jgi:D-serine deaminase-like pyridoxal phosphate-dependent protein
VLRRYPFILILKAAHGDAQSAPLRLKIDPGSKTTGLAIVNDASGEVIWAAELTHRGEAVHEALQRIQAHLKTPLAGAAAVNTLRWALYERLQATGLPVEVGSGGRTKWNRVSRGLPKTHWLDAAAVGASTPAALYADRVTPWLISATGRQRRQMCLVDEDGFPRTRAKASSRVRGFQTGDMVRAIVPKGKKAGAYVGRVAVRASGSCNITTKVGTIEGVSAKYMRTIHRSDGYRYTQKGRRLLPTP